MEEAGLPPQFPLTVRKHDSTDYLNVMTSALAILP